MKVADDKLRSQPRLTVVTSRMNRYSLAIVDHTLAAPGRRRAGE
jgi:hypothetical protein